MSGRNRRAALRRSTASATLGLRRAGRVAPLQPARVSHTSCGNPSRAVKEKPGRGRQTRSASIDGENTEIPYDPPRRHPLDPWPRRRPDPRSAGASRAARRGRRRIWSGHRRRRPAVAAVERPLHCAGGRLEGDRRPVAAAGEAGGRRRGSRPDTDAGGQLRGTVGSVERGRDQGSRCAPRLRHRGGDRRDRYPQRYRAGTRGRGVGTGRRHRPPEGSAAGGATAFTRSGDDPAEPGTRRGRPARPGACGSADAARSADDPSPWR